MNYNKLIDHTLLKQDAMPEQIVKLCDEAKQFDFMSVCVNPGYVPLAAECLKGSSIKVCTVIGFPLGMNLTKTKVEEAVLAVKEGANEVDMVINVGMLKAGHDDYVREEIKEIKQAVGQKIILKVIIETCLLSDDEIVRACKAPRLWGLGSTPNFSDLPLALAQLPSCGQIVLTAPQLERRNTSFNIMQICIQILVPPHPSCAPLSLLSLLQLWLLICKMGMTTVPTSKSCED